MKKIVPLFVFLCCLLSSCWQDVYVDWDEGPARLSLTTRQLCADSAIQVVIQPASRDDYDAYRDSLQYYLQVELRVNGVEQGKMYIEEVTDSLSYFPYTTYYTSDYIPKEGDRIEIHAACEGFEPFKAETRIPSVVPIEKLDYTCECDTASRFIRMELQLTFQDKPTTADYYAYNYWVMIKDSLGQLVYSPFNYGYGDNSFWFRGTQGKIDPIVKFRPNTLDYMLDETSGLDANFFDDSDISGESYTLNFSFSGSFGGYIFNGQYDEYVSILPDTLYVQPVLISMSQDYYYYNISSWASQGLLIGSLTEVGLSDPIKEYSNVDGGVGVLYGCNRSSALLEIVTKDYWE